MKTIISIISILTFAACNDISKVYTVQLPPESSKIVLTKLADSLGTVSIELPTRYDTSFFWTHYSDCGKACEKIKYRFQPKTLHITKESGWISLGEPYDSIYRFTISHSGYTPLHDNDDTSFILKFHEREKANLILCPDTYKIKADTVEKIGDRFFSVFTIDLYDTAKLQYSKKVLAASSIKGNIIHFKFELLTKHSDSSTKYFLNNSKYFLRRIRISNVK